MRAAKKSPTDAVLNLALKDKLSKLSTDGKTSIPEKLPECKKKKKVHIESRQEQK